MKDSDKVCGEPLLIVFQELFVCCRIEDSKRTGEDFENAKKALGDLAESEEDLMSWICFPKQAEDYLKARKENREKKVQYTIEEA